MLKRLAPLAIAGTVGFLIASLLNGGTPASAVSTTSDQVKLINYSACLGTGSGNSWVKYENEKYTIGFEVPDYIKTCSRYLK